MRTTAIVPALALVLAFGIAPHAIAQDAHVIGGVTVPESEVEAVRTKCDELLATAQTAAANSNAPAEAEAPATADDAQADDAAADAAASDATAPVIDLETLTVEQCEEGGFTGTATP